MKTKKELIDSYMNGHWAAVHKLISKKQLLTSAKEYADRVYTLYARAARPPKNGTPHCINSA